MAAPPVPYEPDVPFEPLTLAKGAHAQTILASLLRKPAPVPHHRVRWETPDGDFVDVDRVEAKPGAPHLLVLHGLEGSSRAGYVVEALRHAHRSGFGATALNFRSCSGEPNRQLRSYNSGDITDALFTVQQIRAHGITGPLFGLGFSLGGSVLLNLVARTGDECPLEGACAVSVPFDLGECATLLDTATGVGAVYRVRFLRTLKKKSIHKARLLPGTLDPSTIRRQKGIRGFDDAVTARLYGFKDADDYYTASSTARKLRDIRRPTLLITSDDDPLAPARMLPKDARDNPYLSLLVTQAGGHCGFMTGTALRPQWWAERQAVRFFQRALEKLTAAASPVPS